jgi:glycosyltransferase involved in cell wall biosynthesis
MILSDIPGTPGQFWGEHTTYVGPYKPGPRLVRWLGHGWAYNVIGLVAGLRLFLRRRHADGIVTSGGATGQLFAWLQALVPWGRKPHVMIDCLWHQPQSRLRAFVQRLQIRLAARSVRKFVVWSAHEVEDFAAAFRVPPAQFQFVPFHHTLEDYDYRLRDDGYLFAGGNSDRDYRTLIVAVRPLDVPTWIASTRADLFAGVALPPNARVTPTSEAGFRDALAGAKLVVVPMAGGALRSGGQQTLLNALCMGKPTIAVGRRWAADLMEDRVHGLIVDYGDVKALRAAIEWTLARPAEAKAMAERGRAHARQFSTQRCLETIYEMVSGNAPTVPFRAAACTQAVRERRASGCSATA